MAPLEETEKLKNEQQSNTKTEKAQEIESEIYNSIYSKHLTLVGWYRSKAAGTRALPSLRDSEAQLDHQIKLLGSSDATYSPCIGMIISPYTSGSTESELLTYWTVGIESYGFNGRVFLINSYKFTEVHQNISNYFLRFHLLKMDMLKNTENH